MNGRRTLHAAHIVFALCISSNLLATNISITTSLSDPFCSNDTLACEGLATIPISLSGPCSPDNLVFQIDYDAFNDGSVDATLDPGIVLGITTLDYIISSYFPIGVHQLSVSVVDDCGNIGGIDIVFEVVDCIIAPVSCVSSYTKYLLPVAPNVDADGDGDIDLGANILLVTELIENAITDCTNPVQYSLHKEGETPTPGPTQIIFTCDDPAVMTLHVYAWDAAFNPYSVQPNGTVGGPNYSSCTVAFHPSDDLFCNCDNCGGNSDPVFGHIESCSNGGGVPGVIVTIAGDFSEPDTIVTDSSGFYELPTLQSGDDYTITPYKNDDVDNGVTTFDLVLISKHILGVTPLDSPYKRIAADIDNSGSITVADLIHLRRLILSITDEFENNTSWRFLQASYIFPFPLNPWFEAFPEVINLNNYLEGNLIDGDFIGIKIGDVNGDVEVNQ